MCQTHTKTRAGIGKRMSALPPAAEQHFSKLKETSEELMQHLTTNHAWKSFPKILEYDMEILLFAGLNDGHWMKLFSPLRKFVWGKQFISWQTYHREMLQSLQVKGIPTSAADELRLNITKCECLIAFNWNQDQSAPRNNTKFFHSCLMDYLWCLRFKTEVSHKKARAYASRAERKELKRSEI